MLIISMMTVSASTFLFISVQESETDAFNSYNKNFCSLKQKLYRNKVVKLSLLITELLQVCILGVDAHQRLVVYCSLFSIY